MWKQNGHIKKEKTKHSWTRNNTVEHNEQNEANETNQNKLKNMNKWKTKWTADKKKKGNSTINNENKLKLHMITNDKKQWTTWNTTWKHENTIKQQLKQI